MANYRSLVPGGYFSSPDQKGKVNASIWSNNPGAINGNAAWVRKEPGFVGTVTIGGGNPIAVFETPEQGVALWVKLLNRYNAKSVRGIIKTYGGGQDYSAYEKFVCDRTGLSPNYIIKTDGDDATLIKFARAMFRYEAGVESPLSDEQLLFGFNLARGGTAALPPKRDFASAIYAALKSNGIKVHEGKDVVNIVYIEGCNTDGTPSQNRRNAFDDLRLVLQVDGTPRILGSWEATIETGVKFTENPIASDGKGAARIAFGQQRAWQVGYHRSAYEALVQTGGAVSVYRDDNKDYKREGDRLDTGWFGINQHHGYNAPRDNIGSNSAGCLVGRSVGGHEEFMKLVKSDARYKANRQYVFDTTVMPYSWLEAGYQKPHQVPVGVPAAGFGAGIAAALSWLGANPAVSIAIAIVAAFAVGFALHWRRGKD